MIRLTYLLFSTAFLLLTHQSIGQTDTVNKKDFAIMILEGHYQNVNMYIQNPSTGNGTEFCVIKVLVNGIEIDTFKYPKFEMYSSTFEIPLTEMGFKEGLPLKIELWHNFDCKPKTIYNSPKTTKPIEFTDVTVDSNYVVHFKTKGEADTRTYIIEQFRWNKWVKIGEVVSKEKYDGAEYSFQVVPHSGENVVRIKYYTLQNQPYYSNVVKFTSTLPEVRTNGKCNDIIIAFTGETMYEVLDQQNNIVKRGFGNKVDVTGLKQGVYSLHYDNKKMEIIIKKWK